MRTPDELLASGLKVIDRAEGCGVGPLIPLFSSGDDSACACHVASQHRKWKGEVNLINTGIGSKASRQHAYYTAKEFGWTVREWKSPETYERTIRLKGFPGPGMHQWVYLKLKDRCVRQMMKRRGRVALISGARAQESVRRMGHVEPVKVGEMVRNRKTGRVHRVNLSRVWTAPCHDWSSDEQAAYMDAFDLPHNPVKIALGMSGECFCGAFAAPGELDRIRHHCPDVAEEIDRLTVIARECGTWDRWGQRPTKGEEAAESGPLCSSCDVRARLAGVVFAPS